MNEAEPNPAVPARFPDAPHPRSWQKLETIGDCRRALRWLFLETKRGRLDSQKAARMAFIAAQIINSIEKSDLEARIAAIEAQGQDAGGDRTIHIHVGGAVDGV
jgi:hypothetical protein